MKVTKTIILIICSSHICFAQFDSTLFDTSFETEVFESYINNPRDVLPHELLIALNYYSDDERFINDLANFTNILREKVNGKSLNKKLKTIYKNTHEEFLRKYVGESYFTDIFKSGNYNCVSASALYAIILKWIDIKYEIRQTPGHVYLIGDPKNSGYLIETTLPSEGLYHFDDRFKKDYIKFLNTNKIISDTEYNIKSIDELFQEYYLTDKKIDLIQLAGLQYYNKGFFEYDEEDFNEALKSFRKAEILYQSDIIHFMKNIVLIKLMEKQIQNKNFSTKLLAVYLNSNPFDQDAIDFANYYFKQYSREKIIDHPNIEDYQKEFNDLTKHTSDSVNLDPFYCTFYESSAFYYSSTSDYSKALVNLEELYLLNPENLEVKNRISDNVYRLSAQMGSELSFIDSMDHYMNRFPFVLENKIIGILVQYVYARKVYQYFVSNDSGSGFNYLIRFQNYLDDNSSATYNEEYISLAYAEVGAYFVRKREYQEAIKWLEKGLNYVPNSLELQGRLQRIKEYYGTEKSINYSSELRAESLRLYASYLEKIRINKEAINTAFENNIIGKWELSSTSKSSQLHKDELSVFHFEENNIVIIYLGNEVETRTWSYNSFTCKLSFLKEEDENLSFYVGEINERKMEILMMNDDDASFCTEMIFEAIN